MRCLALLGQALDELLVDLLLDEQPAAGGAALAAVEVDGVERAGDGLRPGRQSAKMTLGLLPPSSNVVRFSVSAAAFWMILAVSTWPVKAILSTSGWTTRACAGRLAQAVDDVDDARREAGLEGQLADAQGGQRRLLGGLHDDGVAAGQGRAPLPGEHQQREVPGDDLADDADRLAQRVGEEAAADGDGAALDLVGPAGVVAERVDDALHVAARVADGLAAVERLERGQLLGVLLDEVGELEHQPAALGGVHRRPGAGLQGRAGGLDGLVDVGGGRRRRPGRSTSPVAGL